MSTYAVFGMTRQYAEKHAKDKTPTRRDGKDLTQSEWLQECRDFAESVFSSTRTAQLSPLFDSSQFARDFIALIPKEEARDICVKARCPVRNGAGTVMRNPKTGKVKMQWLLTN